MATPTYDIIFLVDNTGSMGKYVSAVNNNIIPFANSLDEKNVKYRLGLLSFGDVNDPYTDVGKVKSYGFSDVETFRSNVNSVLNEISDGGGADDPESGLEALVQGDQSALSMITSSTAEYKRFVVVTDASFHNQGDSGEGVTGDLSTFLNTSDVLNALKEAGVVLDVIGETREVSYGDPCQDEWEPLAEATGGKFYDINGNYSMLFEQIVEEISEEVNNDSGTPSEPAPSSESNPSSSSGGGETSGTGSVPRAPYSGPSTPSGIASETIDLITPPSVGVAPVDIPIIGSDGGFGGIIRLAQWGYGFNPTENSPLFGGMTYLGDRA